VSDLQVVSDVTDVNVMLE